MSGDDDEQGGSKDSPSQFDALFAAAEASIDRIKAQKLRDQLEDDFDDNGDEDFEPDEEKRRPARDEGGAQEREMPERAPTMPKQLSRPTRDNPPAPRRPKGPLRSQGAPSKPPPTEKKAAGDEALTAALIRARNELSALLEKQKVDHAREVSKMRERIEQLKGAQGSSRQRAERERNSAVDRDREKVLKTLLPVIDNLERALSANLDAMPDAAKPALESLTTGIDSVIRLAQSSLKQLGVEAFISLGEAFDPERHEAIRRESRTDVPDNTIVEEYHKGYLLNGRLLRAALVVVAQGGPT